MTRACGVFDSSGAPGAAAAVGMGGDRIPGRTAPGPGCGRRRAKAGRIRTDGVRRP